MTDDPVIDETEMSRTLTWTCNQCGDSRNGVQTNHTALVHVKQNEGHVVTAIGTRVLQYRMSELKRVQDVFLPEPESPMSTLHDPADRYYSDPYTTSPE